MVFRSGRETSKIAPLLIAVLLLCGSAAAPFTSKQAYREARAAIADRADVDLALRKTEAALARLGNANDEWTWSLRVLRGELLSRKHDPAGEKILRTELPANLQHSEAEVRRQIALIMLGQEGARKAALAIAEKYQPSLLPDVHLVLANVDEPESHVKIASELGRRAGRPIIVTLGQNVLSRRYIAAGRYAEAVDLGEKALATFRKLNWPGRISPACGNLGWAYEELGDYEHADELFACADDAAAQIGATTERITWLNQRGNIRYVRRDYGAAESYYKRALALEPRNGDVLTNLARLYADTGRFNEARSFVNQALEVRRGSADRLRPQLVDAQIDARTNNVARAEKTLQAIIEETKDAQTRWEAEAGLADVYVRMQRGRDAEKQFKAAIETARTTRESITRPELRFAFFNVVAEVFDAYVDFLVRQKRDDEALAVTEISRAQTLEEGLKIKTAQRAVDPRALAQQHGLTILCYWLGKDRSYVWTITPKEISIASLPAEAIIENAVDAYGRDLLAPGPRASLQGSGKRGMDLYRTLVPGTFAKNARVAVIADGRLHALSFETLVVPAPKPHYWIEDVVLTNASSLQLLGTAAPKRTGAPSMLVVGNAIPVDPLYPKLQNAGEEVQLVARRFAKKLVLDGAKATPAAYRNAVPGMYEYLHFVAHGVATRTQPLESAVILSPDASHAYKLFARDIINQPLTARLVTISSCHGAGTRTYTGEGLVGLAWAFLRAGAEQVIAALWEVNDNATPQLMDRMYASIRAGADPAVALRNAKLSLVHSNSVYRNARYWAPFVLYSGS